MGFIDIPYSYRIGGDSPRCTKWCTEGLEFPRCTVGRTHQGHIHQRYALFTCRGHQIPTSFNAALQTLQECTQWFIKALSQSVKRMPYSIRYLARETLTALRVDVVPFKSSITLMVPHRKDSLTLQRHCMLRASGDWFTIAISIQQ
jgi:hypothetical protein